MKNQRLHPDTITEVKERVDIIDVVSDYVVLNKKGNNFFGLCPFHEEKTPSFIVNPNKQAYHCFGCGVGGGSINFLMEIGKQSFSEVVLNLAQRYQIPIKTLIAEESKQIQQEISLKQQLYEILDLATIFYQHTLTQKEGKNALEYLKKTRNITTEIIQKFQLGYAPIGWETIYHYLVEIKHYPVNLVEKTGLIKKRNQGGGFYDQFRDRLIIPIHNQQGQVIGFGSRCLDGSEPKYLNSPETLLFNKSKVLFALDKAKKAIIKQDQVIIVEGYFDAISLHQFGIENAVAVMGTALSNDHIKQLARYSESKEIILNFDADKAGIKATERGIKQIESLIYSGQLQLKIINIPEGKDADDFLKSDDSAITKYRELIKNSPLWIDWQIDLFINSKDLKKANEFDQVINFLITLLNKISNLNTRNYYVAYCAELLSKNRSDSFSLNSEDFQQIQRTLQISLKQNSSPNSKSNTQKSSLHSIAISPEQKLLEKSEYLLLLIYLYCPPWRSPIIDLLEAKNLTFTVDYYSYLWQKIIEIKDFSPTSLNDDSQTLISTLTENIIEDINIRKQLSNLFNPDTNQQEYLHNSETIINSAIATLEWLKLKKYYQYCQQQWRTLDINLEQEKMTFYNEELKKTKLNLDNLELIRLSS